MASSLPPVAPAGHPGAKVALGDTYQQVRGLGLAKRASGDLVRVKLRDGDTVLTHGLDPEPAGLDRGADDPAAPDRAVDFASPERPPVCATDHYQHVLYGYPAGAPNRLTAVMGAIQAEIRRMNALLNESGLLSGGRTADYKVLCDGASAIRVDAFPSTQPDALTDFAGVVAAARQAGFKSPNADYTIFFDSSAPNACGTGTISTDQRLIAENSNNSGGDYAVVYSDCWTDRTAMHENAHNQGAVQYDAPNSTGSGAHCNDGYDIMCYSPDGGDKGQGVLNVFCTDKMHFDCRNDTYFDTAPEVGEYLASNWNLGSPLNRFIAFDEGGPPPPVCGDGTDNDGDGRIDFPGDPGCTSAADQDEFNLLPACLDLQDNDGDGRRDYPSDPGCSSVLDNDEGDPVQLAEGVDADPVRSLPTLSLAAARRYARQRIKLRSPRARQITATCSKRNRTTANCRVRWRTGPRSSYRGTMVVKFRWSGSRAALAATSRTRRYR